MKCAQKMVLWDYYTEAEEVADKGATKGIWARIKEIIHKIFESLKNAVSKIYGAITNAIGKKELEQDVAMLKEASKNLDSKTKNEEVEIYDTKTAEKDNAAYRAELEKMKSKIAAGKEVTKDEVQNLRDKHKKNKGKKLLIGVGVGAAITAVLGSLAGMQIIKTMKNTINANSSAPAKSVPQSDVQSFKDIIHNENRFNDICEKSKDTTNADVITAVAAADSELTKDEASVEVQKIKNVQRLKRFKIRKMYLSRSEKDGKSELRAQSLRYVHGREYPLNMNAVRSDLKNAQRRIQQATDANNQNKANGWDIDELTYPTINRYTTRMNSDIRRLQEAHRLSKIKKVMLNDKTI